MRFSGQQRRRGSARPGARNTLRTVALVAAALCAVALTATALPDQAPRHPVQLQLAKSTLPATCGGKNGCQEQFATTSGATVPVYRNFPLSGSPEVTHALVVVHGAGRNPVSTFTGMMAAVSKVGATEHTLVVAPWFKTSQDHPAKHEATWTDDGWKQGDGAVQPAGLSSFAVLDQIVATLANRSRFPNLSWITLVGHSAGGQFIQRYAAFGQEPNLVRTATINYVPANPSSYVYFTPTRPTGNGFTVPNATHCPNYDTYKYGMAGRTGYVAALNPAQAFATYTSRRVTILNGGADTFDNGDLDTACGAMLEGPNRASRGANYVNYIHQLAPNAPHDRIVVPGVDHNHYALFESPLAAPVLFGTTTPGAAVAPRPTNNS